MKALALFIAISSPFLAFSAEPSISKRAASLVKSVSTGIATACCYNAAALTPFLIKNMKSGPQRYLIAYSALPLLYTGYALQRKVKKEKKDSQEQKEESTKKESPRQEEMSAKNVLYNLGKVALFALHAASAAAFVVCSIEHLEKIQKKVTLLADAINEIQNQKNLFKQGQKQQGQLLGLVKKGLEKEKALANLINEGQGTKDLLVKRIEESVATETLYAQVVDKQENTQDGLVDLIHATRDKESYFADLTNDRCSLVHHVIAIPVLLHTGYQLLTSALHAFKKMNATRETQETPDDQVPLDEPSVKA